MPRNDPTRIDPRQVVDSSQSANVPLQVQASMDHAGRGGAGWAIAHALNQFAASSAEGFGRAHAAKQKAKIEQDKKDGKAAAAEAAVTGMQKTAEELDAHGKVFTQAYQESDGQRHRYQFEQDLRPELAKLEPGADVNAFIQEKAREYVQNAGMQPEASKSFMTEVAKAQPEWKIEYTKHSINESLKREEENHQAILTGEVNRVGALTPDTLSAWRQKGAEAGLNDYELDQMAVKAVTPALASGKVDIKHTLETLQGHSGAEGRVLYDLYQQDFDNAATAGKRVQDQERKKAQEDALTKTLFSMNDQADVGMLSDRAIEATRKQYEMTPEWAAQMHNRNRDAQHRLAKEAQEADKDRERRVAFLRADAIHIEALGADKVVKAGEKALQETIAAGIQQKDFSAVPQYIAAAARNNMKLEGYGRMVAGLADTSNPERFDMAYQLYKGAQNVAPGWAEANLDTKTLAALKQYDRRLTVYHDTGSQALAAARSAPEIDKEVLAQEKKAVMKKVGTKPIIPDFDDSQWLSTSPHGATKVSNIPEVQGAILGYIEDAHRNGQFFGDPAGAIEFAKEKFKADYVKVGDRYERAFGSTTSNAQSASVGDAMAELGKSYHDALVKNKVIDQEAKVGFAPTPNAPNKWQLFYLSGGERRVMTHEVAITDPATGETRKEEHPIEATASEIAAKHEQWAKQEKTREDVTKQGIKQYGMDFMFGSYDPAKKLEYLDRIPKDAVDGYMHGFTGESLPRELATPEQRKKAREFLTAPERTTQSFADFLKTTH